MSTYLFSWNPNEWDSDNLNNLISNFSNGQKQHKWCCGNTKKPCIGDRIFLIKRGDGKKGIFGSGKIVSDRFEGDHFNPERKAKGDKAWYVEIQFDYLVDPSERVVIDKYELDETDNLKADIWNARINGVQIPPEIAQNIEAVWGERTGSIGLSYPDELDEGRSYPEGVVKLVSVNRYERDATARLACLEKWGYECSVCSLHLELFYGPIGKSYIHVHHLKPISTVGENYKVDPINELRPVCPNCHAMLHQASPPLTIEELQKRVSLYGSRLS